MTAPPLIIIGTGLAGYTLAKEFRKLDTERSLVLITEDSGDFYSKPMLSESISKQKTADQLIRFTAEQMAQQLNAQIHTFTRIEHIDPEHNRLSFSDTSLSYGDLVLACGARPRLHPLKDDLSDRLHHLNHLDDYRRFHGALTENTRVLIIGSGLIGTEIANDLAKSNIDITMVSPSSSLMDATLPIEVAKELQTALQDEGVRFYLNQSVESVTDTDDGVLVTLDDGTELQTDVVLSAIGLEPATDLAESAELIISNAINTNRYLETSQPNIYALGDCAEVDGAHLMYVMPIMNSARALAKTLSGTPTEVNYPIMPVSVKTPSYPITFVLPPSSSEPLKWQIEADENGIKALHYDNDGELNGYILTRDKTADKKQLNPQIKPKYHS